MIRARAVLFAGWFGLFSAPADAFADDTPLPKQSGGGGDRRRAVRLGLTTVTVMDEGESIKDVINRARERRERRARERGLNTRPDNADRVRDRVQDRVQDRMHDRIGDEAKGRRAILREKLRNAREGHNAREGQNAGAADGNKREPRPRSPRAEAPRERLNDRPAADRVGGDRTGRPRRVAP